MTESELNDYFESAEFKAELVRYEEMVAAGCSAYFEAEQLTDIAEYYAKNGHMDKAFDAIEMALRLHPGSTDPLIFKARTYMLQGDVAKAYELADSIPEQCDREVAFLYAELMLCEQRPDDASEYMERKLLQGGDDDTLEEVFSTLLDITHLFKDNQFFGHGIQWAQKLLEYANRIPNNDEELVIAKEMLATCHLGDGHIDEAIVLFNEVIDINPYHYRAWMMLGDVYSILLKWDKAFDAYNYALAIEPESELAKVEIANCYSRLGNLEKAVEMFEQLCQNDSSYIHYRYGLSMTLVGEFYEAMPHLLKSLENPDDDAMLIDCCYYLCMSHLGVADIETATQFFCMLKDLFPDSPKIEEMEIVLQEFQEEMDKQKAMDSELSK